MVVGLSSADIPLRASLDANSKLVLDSWSFVWSSERLADMDYHIAPLPDASDV
jgi:hypothetical protein